jgi:hypothetical protein
MQIQDHETTKISSALIFEDKASSLNTCVFVCFILVFLLSTSCKYKESFSLTRDENIVAKVGDKTLTLDDIKDFTAGAESEEDSLYILKAYVNSWVKDQLLVREAEKNVSADFDINKLVKDYKASLLLHSYIDNVLIKQLDTAVTKIQFEEYYEENKQQYILSEPILKFHYFKVNLKQPKIKDFEKAWNNNDGKADELGASIAQYTQNSTTSWVTSNELFAILPKNLFNVNDLTKKGKTMKSDQNFKYFVKILDLTEKNKVPPFEYIEAIIKSVITNDRKQKLLKKIKEDLYIQFSNTADVNSYLE